MLRRLAPCLCLLLLGVGIAQAEPSPDAGLERSWYEGRIRAISGFDYSTGDYGSEGETEFWVLPFALEYTFENFSVTPYDWDELSFRVSLPIIWCDAARGVVCGPDSEVLPEPGPPGGKRSTSGVGDMSLALAYAVVPRARWIPVTELSFRVKLPTGDEDESLGLGEPAYTLRVDLGQTFRAGTPRHRFSPFAGIGYRFVDDPFDHGLDDYWLASLGGSYRFSRWFSLGLAYDWREASCRRSNRCSTTADRHELTPFAAIRTGERWTFGPYSVVGLSSSSVNYALGMAISVRGRVH